MAPPRPAWSSLVRQGCSCAATSRPRQALGLRVSTETEYPKSHCEDATEQAAACAGWAAKGECIKNHPFMSQALCRRTLGHKVAS